MKTNEIFESLNLYDLHDDPKELRGHDQADTIPEVAWDRYEHNIKMLKKLENLWAKDPEYAFKYACAINKRFRAGEAILSTSPEYAFQYLYRFHDRFPKGEFGFEKGINAIAKNPEFAYMYSREILDGPFVNGEKAIATNPKYAYSYAKRILKSRFPEGEKSILKSEYAERYKEHFAADFRKDVIKPNIKK